MCALKRYNNLFLRRYILERYNLENSSLLVDIVSVEVRVSVKLEFLNVLTLLEFLIKLESIIGLKLNYKILDSNYVAIRGNIRDYRVWKFLNCLFNYDYILNLKKLDTFKFGINRGSVVDFDLKNFIDESIPMRISLRLMLRGSNYNSRESKLIVDSTFKVLGLYK